ncbi:MAG: transposase [Oligoflexia bacterium]|nr:transposase [Oligoflexia bacterium]
MKYHPHGSVLFVTFSVEQGLLLLSNPLCEALIKSCLARAQFLYPVEICHFLVEATHIHMVLVVKNPDDVCRFVGYFKTESAHTLNGLLGREKRTVWCEGYDSPVILSPLREFMCIAPRTHSSSATG